jgi:hypothetical protein
MRLEAIVMVHARISMGRSRTARTVAGMARLRERNSPSLGCSATMLSLINGSMAHVRSITAVTGSGIPIAISCFITGQWWPNTLVFLSEPTTASIRALWQLPQQTTQQGRTAQNGSSPSANTNDNGPLQNVSSESIIKAAGSVKRRNEIGTRQKNVNPSHSVGNSLPSSEAVKEDTSKTSDTWLSRQIP